MIRPDPLLKIKLTKLIVIIITWMCIGVIISVYDLFTMHSQMSAGTHPDYTFLFNLGFNVAAAFMGSALGGIFLVFYVNERFRNKPYWQSIVAVTIAFFVIVALITLLLGVVFAVLRTGQFITEPESKAFFWNFILDATHLKNIIAWSTVVALTQFFLQINDKFGQGILWNFIRGKYHSPKEEMRVFMFVDLASSTTIAERLGNEKYHSLLKDFFADITDPIIHNRGEIYQYVGDEIVISWKLKNGLQNNQCLLCYFDMRKAITDQKEKYESTYGLMPDFKAGMHYGKVIAGEIGIIKRDITFSGDVLNTAARIQSKCNEYNVRILSSDELLSLLSYDEFFQRIPIGDIELKGKGSRVALSTLQAK